MTEAVMLSHVMTEHLLSKKFSVIIDRMLWNELNESVNAFEHIAKKLGCPFIHIYLTANLETVISRADERGYPKEAEGGLSRDKVIKFHERTTNSLSNHAEEFTINTTDMSEDEVYNQAKAILEINLR